MGYFLHGLIATEPVLEAHVEDWHSASVVRLEQGLALIPITEELLDEIGLEGDSGEFERLTPDLSIWAMTISTKGRVAYIEAEFFGGIGGQSATVFSEGDRILSVRSPNAINEALRLIGVSSKGYFDEFEAIGLLRHRNTKDWLADAIPRTE